MNQSLQIQYYSISINFETFSMNQIILEELIFISQKANYIIALLTNNDSQFFFIQFHFNIDLNLEKAEITNDFKIIRLLPSLSGYYITQNTVYSNGYLVMLYSPQGGTYIQLSIYDVGEISNDYLSLLIPVLLQKQSNRMPQKIISYQCIYNISQQLLNVVLFTNSTYNNHQQYILEINPKLQLEYSSIQKSVFCGNEYLYANFQIIDQPDFIWNLIFSSAVILLLVLCFCRLIEKSELQLELENIEL